MKMINAHFYLLIVTLFLIVVSLSYFFMFLFFGGNVLLNVTRPFDVERMNEAFISAK